MERGLYLLLSLYNGRFGSGKRKWDGAGPWLACLACRAIQVDIHLQAPLFEKKEKPGLRSALFLKAARTRADNLRTIKTVHNNLIKSLMQVDTGQSLPEPHE
jgi:hypothetical protein